MTNQETLQKAINRATDNGLDIMKLCHLPEMEFDYVVAGNSVSEDILVCYYDDHESKSLLLNTYELIFNHDFAKALWGIKIHQTSYEDFPENWQHHLQQMVLADDPVKYLGGNI